MNATTPGEGGFTLFEMILVFAVLAVIGGVSTDLFITFLRTMDSQHFRAEISLNLAQSLESDVVRQIRLADKVQVSGASNSRVDYHDAASGAFYTLYFYNSNDTALGQYDQPAYALMRASMASLGAAFPYGSGDVVATELLPPASFYAVPPAVGQPGVALNLTAARDGETFQIRQQVCPRNQ